LPERNANVREGCSARGTRLNGSGTQSQLNTQLLGKVTRDLDDDGLNHDLRAALVEVGLARAGPSGIGMHAEALPPSSDARLERRRFALRVVASRRVSVEAEARVLDVTDRAAFADLIALVGDSGATALLKHRPEGVAYLDTAESGALLDIDTPGDLAAAARAWKPCATSATSDSATSRGALPKP
jgi:molybdenum cofactor cytidylyltransferase